MFVDSAFRSQESLSISLNRDLDPLKNVEQFKISYLAENSFAELPIIKIL